jgi:hypothetical protein
VNILSAGPTREPAFDVHRPGGTSGRGIVFDEYGYYAWRTRPVSHRDLTYIDLTAWWNTALLRALVVRVMLRPRPAKWPAP